VNTRKELTGGTRNKIKTNCTIQEIGERGGRRGIGVDVTKTNNLKDRGGK